MPDIKKSPVDQEKKEHKGSCDSEKPQTCNTEKEEEKSKSSCNDKSSPQKDTGHKHGGSCSH